jgi:hypothetical protein
VLKLEKKNSYKKEVHGFRRKFMALVVDIKWFLKKRVNFLSSLTTQREK